MGKGELFAGRFELIEELGAGGMGIVYRAYDKKVGEEIALKILHPEIALDERTVDRFRNEIKLARRISHRNVCRMHELHEEGKILFITMEYVSGQDLKGLIGQTKGLAAGRAISIAKQVAEGLCEAHNLGVIHRDLKPQNIMVDKEGAAKIMDFGIARSLRAAGMTAEGMIIGTPEYMAPEQVEGLEADQRTDLYAMGAILFEMVTGRVPFEGDSALSVAYKHKNEIPIPPRKLNAEIPEPFNKLILRCLEKQKENRYQTAEELLADLIRIEEGLPISERVALPARPTFRIAREKSTSVRRLLVPALIVVVLAVASVLIWRLLPKRAPISPGGASGKPSIAVLYFENLSNDPTLEGWRTGLSDLLTTSLQQSKLVATLDGNRVFGGIRFSLSVVCLLRKKYDRAVEELDNVERLKSSAEWAVNKGDVFQLKGDLATAEKEYLHVLGNEDKGLRNLARRSLCLLYLLRGQFGRSRAELQKALQPGGDLEKELQPGRPLLWNLPAPYIFLRSGDYEAASEIIDRQLNMAVARGDTRSQALALWRKGLVAIERKLIPEADGILRELKVVCDQSFSTRLVRYGENLQGLLDLEKGETASAVDFLKKASSRLPFESAVRDTHALFYFPLAEAYFASGNLDMARTEFEKITLLTTGRISYGDLYTKSFYWLGRIADEQKDKARARENYGKFLDLWKDADPGPPEVDDARARLAALR